MKKWEYCVFAIDGDQDDETPLNDLGQQGWDLVTINDGYAYLKREVLL